MTGNIGRVLFAGSALLAGLFPGLVTAGPASAASSAAYGIEAQFGPNNNMVVFEPLAEIEGSAPPPYDDTVAAKVHNQVVPIVGGVGPQPSLFLYSAAFTSHVASSGLVMNGISTEADTAIKGINFALMLNPPPPVLTATAQPIQPAPFLTLSARKIDSTANFNQGLPSYASVTGSASFDHLVVTGSLVGNQKLEFSGAAPIDTMLYQSPNVTITLNQEVRVALITCGLTCVVIPEITTYGVAIVLEHANLFGRIVSGQIFLGMAGAGQLPHFSPVQPAAPR
jgi:hypothetical protein